MSDRSLLIVRGGRNEPDPTFSCIAHSTKAGHYAAIEFEDGLVTNRTLYRGAERRLLQRLAESPTYTSVYADTRADNHLLPFKFPKHALTADLNLFRRAKSDEEISSIQRMAGILQASREYARDEQHFRGTVDSLNYRHAVQEREGTEFTLKRYGLQDEMGRSVELSSVEPHTLDWKARMLRVDNGCRAVKDQLREGATGTDIDKTFRSHLDPTEDVIYGSVLHHTGYQAWEDELDVDVLKRYDVLTICPIVGDKQGNSVPYMHSVHAITDEQFRGVASYDSLFRGNHPVFLENLEKVVKMWNAHEPDNVPKGDGSSDNKSFEDWLEGGYDEFIGSLYDAYNTVGISTQDVNTPDDLLNKLIQLSKAVKDKEVKIPNDEKPRVALVMGYVIAPLFEDQVTKPIEHTHTGEMLKEVEGVVTRFEPTIGVLKAKTEIVKLKETLEEKTKQLEMMDEKIKTFETVQGSVAALTAELDGLRTRIEQSNSGNDSADQIPASTPSDDLADKFLALQHDVRSLQKNVNETLTTEQNSLADRVTALETQVKELQSQRESLRKDITTMAKELKEFRKTMTNATATSDIEVTSEGKEIRALQEKFLSTIEQVITEKWDAATGELTRNLDKEWQTKMTDLLQTIHGTTELYEEERLDSIYNEFTKQTM